MTPRLGSSQIGWVLLCAFVAVLALWLCAEFVEWRRKRRLDQLMGRR